jgi:hypothetical protein
MNDIANRIKQDYQSTTETWRQRPTFLKKVVVNPDESTATVTTKDNVYRFLHDGTSVRYAVMPKRFEPKTTVNRLGSSAGRGRRTHLDFLNPKPGITGRNWTKRIIQLREKLFEARLRAAMSKAVQESNHAR